MTFDQWDTWKRALVVNALGIVGAGFGFSSSETKLSPKYEIPIVVFVLAFLNLMFLVVRPRILAARAGGRVVAAFPLFIEVVRERPLIVCLVVLQLFGISRSATAAATFLQVASGERLRSLSNTSGFWMVICSSVMTAVAGVWLAGAIGLWCNRRWAWWLALVLNGLAASITGVLQLLDLHSYLLDVGAIAASILLLLPSVRNGNGSVRRDLQRA
jgi:hypothetical protein